MMYSYMCKLKNDFVVPIFIFIDEIDSSDLYLFKKKIEKKKEFL